jgi:hypothetical protein
MLSQTKPDRPLPRNRLAVLPPWKTDSSAVAKKWSRTRHKWQNFVNCPPTPTATSELFAYESMKLNEFQVLA